MTEQRPRGYGPGIGTPFVERTPSATSHCSKCIVMPDNRFLVLDSATAHTRQKRTAGAGVPPSRKESDRQLLRRDARMPRAQDARERPTTA